MLKLSKLFILSLLLLSCTKNDEPQPDEALYFPPLSGNTWETTDAASLGWNTNQIPALYEFLEANDTRAFILLKDGKIVLENYWGQKISSTESFDANSFWYWASAGKTITATLIGIAQEEGLLNIDDPSSQYLGEGWTSLSPSQESQITIKRQLTMTTGLDYEVADLMCTEPACLQYMAPPNTQWYYHNAPYTLLDGVLENATGRSRTLYTNEKIAQKIGMNGFWSQVGYNGIYFSTPRSMARFGLMILNDGDWGETPIISDKAYLQAMTNSSQSLNPAYGYLWWLNGKTSIVYPGNPNSFSGVLAPQAPSDMIAGLGANGQILDIIPSQRLVVIRMGEAPSDGGEVPVIFHNLMWEKINEIIR